MKTKGHWPRGKRRNDPGKHWTATVRKLRRIVARPGSPPGTPPAKRCSRKGLAAALSVSDRTVRRWLADEDRPTELQAMKIADWCAAALGRSRSIR